LSQQKQKQNLKDIYLVQVREPNVVVLHLVVVAAVVAVLVAAAAATVAAVVVEVVDVVVGVGNVVDTSMKKSAHPSQSIYPLVQLQLQLLLQPLQICMSLGS